MATERTPQVLRCSTRAAKSAVKVPKQRTGSSLRSGGTATHSSVEPISRPAASGCRGATGWVTLDLEARRFWLFMAGWSQLATAGAQAPTANKRGNLIDGVWAATRLRARHH